MLKKMLKEMSKVMSKKKLKRIALLGFSLSFAVLSGCALFQTNETGELVEIDAGDGMGKGSISAIPPQTKPNGDRFTIAYADIDPYPISGQFLYYFIMSLRDAGWITFDTLPFDPEDTDAGALIDWLAARDVGPYIRFDSSANYYVAFQSEEEVRESITQHVDNGTVDVIISSGTWPSAMLKSFDLDVPIMMVGVVDPVGSGLVDSVEDSGNPNLWATFDPTANERQLAFYYDCIPFTNMGIVYYDEVIASVASYEKIAAQLGVKITHTQIPRREVTDEDDTDTYHESLIGEFKKLVENEGIDAFMLTTDIITDVDRTEELLSVFTDNGIPVFVQIDSGYVQHGALMNVSAFELEGLSAFCVRTLTQVLTGTPLSELPQEYRNSPYLVMNLDVAERIGYRPTFEMLLAAEQIFTSVDS